MLKWAVVRDDRRNRSGTKSLKKRRRVSRSNIKGVEGELISVYKNRTNHQHDSTNYSKYQCEAVPSPETTNRTINNWRTPAQNSICRTIHTDTHKYNNNNNMISESKSQLNMNSDHLPSASVNTATNDQRLSETSKYSQSEYSDKTNPFSSLAKQPNQSQSLKNESEHKSKRTRGTEVGNNKGIFAVPRIPTDGIPAAYFNRPIKVPATTATLKPDSRYDSSSPEIKFPTYLATKIHNDNDSIALEKRRRSTLPRCKKRYHHLPTVISSDNIMRSKTLNNDESSPIIQKPLQNLHISQCDSERDKVPPKTQTVCHDTTDPEFLENCVTFSASSLSNCAKKVTLKRSELRKLERMRNRTDRLNRFLKRYYRDCLPNLPEEEEEQNCSLEEKSVSLLHTPGIEEKSQSFPVTKSSSLNCITPSGNKSNSNTASERRRNHYINGRCQKKCVCQTSF